jgi:putative transcriptional regulator
MEITQGKVLIAQPFLNDGYFKRAVILLAEHNHYGSMGFVMNKPMNLFIKDVLPDYPDLKQPLFYGGPVGQDQLFFVHRFGNEIHNSLPVSNGFYWGGDFTDVLNLLRSKKISNKDIKFFIGYAGWEAQQIEDEYREKAWFSADADYKNLMDQVPQNIWGNELKKMGSNYGLLADFPEDPSLN